MVSIVLSEFYEKNEFEVYTKEKITPTACLILVTYQLLLNLSPKIGTTSDINLIVNNWFIL